MISSVCRDSCYPGCDGYWVSSCHDHPLLLDNSDPGVRDLRRLFHRMARRFHLFRWIGSEELCSLRVEFQLVQPVLCCVRYRTIDRLPLSMYSVRPSPFPAPLSPDRLARFARHELTASLLGLRRAASALVWKSLIASRGPIPTRRAAIAERSATAKSRPAGSIRCAGTTDFDAAAWNRLASDLRTAALLTADAHIFRRRCRRRHLAGRSGASTA